MEKITITMETVNDVFVQSGEGVEVARILRALAEKIEHDYRPETILDFCGNKVGTVKYE